MLRIKNVKFTHVLPVEILAALRAVHPGQTQPLASIKVHFADNGETYGATVRHSGNTLGVVGDRRIIDSTNFCEKILVLPDSVKQYLAEICQQAIEIVQPIVTNH